jgi:hypothetical protein
VEPPVKYSTSWRLWRGWAGCSPWVKYTACRRGVNNMLNKAILNVGIAQLGSFIMAIMAAILSTLNRDNAFLHEILFVTTAVLLGVFIGTMFASQLLITAIKKEKEITK